MNEIIFASAYRQLQSHERRFVDDLIAELDAAAAKAGERISLALHRPIPRSSPLLDRALVRAAIAERINEIAAAEELTVRRIVRELSSIAFSNLGDFMKIDPHDGTPMFDLTDATREQLSVIQSIDIETIGDGLMRDKKVKFKIKLHDKIATIKMLMQYMGMLEPDNPHWRSERTSAEPPPVTTPEEAADVYSAMLGE